MVGCATSGTHKAGLSCGTGEYARAPSCLARGWVSSGVGRQSLRRTPIDHKQTHVFRTFRFETPKTLEPREPEMRLRRGGASLASSAAAESSLDIEAS